MATRLYFPATASNTSGLTPSYNASWNNTAEAARCDLARTKGSSAITAGTRVGPWTATAGQNALDRQFISRKLAAQTISGTFSLMLMVREYATSDNVDRIITGLYVVNPSGTVVATLKALGNSGSTLEFANTTAMRTHTGANAAALTSYDCADGDRIVVEIGYSNSTAATTPEASAKWGENATDATLGDNATTTDRAGWVEFSANLVWLDDIVGSSSGSATTDGVLTGVGALSASAAGSATATAAAIALGMMSGSAAGVATTDGILSEGTVTSPISGSAAGTATVAASLTATGAISGSAAGSSTVAGALTGVGAMVSAPATGTATASGALVGLGAVAGSAAGSCTVVGALEAMGRMVGLAAGVATTSGTLAGSGAASGASAGIATVSGALVGRGAVAGTSSGDATATATAVGIGHMSGSAAGVATVTTVPQGAMSASAAGSSTTTATIYGIGRLAGAVAAAATVAAALGGVGQLAGDAAGLSEVVGSLQGAAAVSGSAEGSSSATGALTEAVIVPVTIAELAALRPRAATRIEVALVAPATALEIGRVRPSTILEIATITTATRLDIERARPLTRIEVTMNTQDPINVGDTVEIPFSFKSSSSGLYVDPTTVRVVVTDPSANEATYTYPSAQVVHQQDAGGDLAGRYAALIDADEAGMWTVRIESPGPTGKARSREFRFEVFA